MNIPIARVFFPASYWARSTHLDFIKNVSSVTFQKRNSLEGFWNSLFHQLLFSQFETGGYFSFFICYVSIYELTTISNSTMKIVALAELASLSIYLTGVVVSYECLQTESFTSFSVAGPQSRGPQRRVRIEARRECNNCRQGRPYVSDLPSTLDSSITSPSPNDFKVAKILMKSFLSAVLSAIVILGGPDVFRRGEDFNSAGLCSLRPHVVLALTEEQVNY